MKIIRAIPLARWVALCLLVVMVAWFLKGDVELMIRNESGGVIKITSCALNGESIPNCMQELPNNQVFFINPQRLLYPKNNNFILTMADDKKFACDFRKVSRECIADIASTKDGRLVCAADCISVYR